MKRDQIWEWGVGALSLTILLIVLRPFLLGHTSFDHDNTFWEYPIFHFFAESLLNGHLPLWNPYEHGGEAFYPILGAPRFLDPTDPLTVIIGGFFTRNTLVLHHWSRVIKTLVILFFAYLCLRPWIKSRWGRISLFPLLLFSYYAVGSFREQSYVAQFASVPIVYFFLQRVLFLGDRRWLNWIGLGAFFGLNFQTYHFTSVSIFLLFLLGGLALFHREPLRRLVDRRILAPVLICLAMMGPNLFLYLTQGRYVYPVRMVPADFKPGTKAIRSPINFEGGPENIVSALKLPYDLASFSGTVAKAYDYVEALIPDPAFFVGGKVDLRWRIFHDSHSYLGVLAWALGLIGLLFDPRPWFRRVWGFCFFGMALFMLGPGGGIHRVLYHLFPPVSMFRHTIMLMPVALFPLLFLIGSGVETGRVGLHFDRISVLLVFNLTVLLVFVVMRVPEDYAWMVILPVGALFLFGHRRWKPMNTFWALFLPPVILAGFLAPNPTMYAGWALISFAVLALWQIGKLPTGVLVLCLMLDFAIHLYMSRPLFAMRPSAVRLLNVDTEARAPKFPQTRGWYAYDFPHDPQPIRYLATLYRRPTAFSTPFDSPVKINSFEKALRNTRWTSYHLPRTYFDLIHSDYPVHKMEWAFACGTETLQFFSGPENRWSKEILEYYPGLLRLQVKTDQPGFLYWSDGYSPEWRGKVDGRPVKVNVAERHFKSIAIPPGVHTVEFRFEPRFFLFLVGLFYFAFFGSLLAMALTVLPLPAWVCSIRSFATVFGRKHETTPA